MNTAFRSAKWTAFIGAACGVASCATAPVVAPAQVAGQNCVRPPVEHCPEADCPTETVTSQGPAVEPGTGRNFFLDYPCDLRADEEVTFVLNLHGGGSYGNWQRHYFPIFDYVDEYRLIVASPNAPPRVWTDVDDEYLQNIVDLVYDQFGDNIGAFWLAGHSQGGLTSRRIVCTDFFADKVDGWLSLSGGRLGSQLPVRQVAPEDQPNGGTGLAAGSLAAPIDCDFSFIYESGEHELGDGRIETSEWADRYNCDAQVRLEDVVDTVAGYVWDPTRQDPGSDQWGHEPGPGTAEVYEYPNCDGGRVVADVVRIDKGHTEGLEPEVTETLVQLMLSAPGGKASEG